MNYIKGEIQLELNSLLDYASLFVLQYLPNGLIYILAGYTFANKTINKRDYLFSSIILAVLGLATKVFSYVRLGSSSNSLPQILIIFLCIFLLIYKNKFSVMHAIISTLIAMILQLIFEAVYIVIILQKVLGISERVIFSQPVEMFSIIGLPYLVTLGLVILWIYKVRMKRRMHNENTGSIGKKNM